MLSMNLSKALRYQKRVKENIRKLEASIQNDNSKITGETRETDVRLALNQRKAWVKHLMNLKLAIQRASDKIREDILMLAETKAEISFLNNLSVLNGVVPSRYRDEKSTTYETIINNSERNNIVTTLQDKIDDLQTRIDAFNNSTKIELADPDLP